MTVPDYGLTPLHDAAAWGDLEAVISLIEGGADVNSVSSYDGLTPLMCAAAFGNLEVVQHLHEKGADLNRFAKRGDTALMMADLKGHDEVVSFLIAVGAENFDKLHPW